MSALVHKTTESDVDLNRLDFILSEPLPDHYDDIVGNSKDTKTGGWEIPQRNLPALAFHDSKSIVGRWDGVRWERGALRGRLVLAPPGTSKIVDEVRALIKSGCLKACSVGFRALERVPRPKGGLISVFQPRAGLRLEGAFFVGLSMTSDRLVFTMSESKANLWKLEDKKPVQ